MLEAASFAIAVVTLLVAIATLALGDKGNQGVRYAFAGFFLALTVVFVLVGVFALVGSDTGSAETPAVSTPSENNAFNATEPLIINGRSFSVPNDTTVKCVAREQTGYTNTGVEYNLTIPTGWVIVWDSWKAYWPNGKYEQDGLLTIYGRWEGKVTIINGEYCAVPIEWKDFAINDRMSAVSSSNRQSFSIGEVP